MHRPPERNGSVARGVWGEEAAAEYLRRGGYVIVERNARPCRKDRRLEIDIVAYHEPSDAMVFVEVKQHAGHSPWERRLRSVDRRKLDLMRRACNAWRFANAFGGNVRFDVIEVYGEPGGGRPEIDHIPDVRLFATRDRFAKW